MFPNGIPQGAWTHLNFAFLYIDPINYTVVPMDAKDVSLYRNFTNLKLDNSGLETWVSVGGWSMNDPGSMNRTFSELAADVDAQDAFAASIIAFMDEYGFDGVDIDWVRSIKSRYTARNTDDCHRNTPSPKNEQVLQRILRTMCIGSQTYELL